MAARRRFSREFKVEAVRLVRERGVTLAQAACDFGVHVNVLRVWVRDYQADPAHAFPGEGQQKPEALEVTQLRREVARLKMDDANDSSHRLAREPVSCSLRSVR